jgi:hypothetical protein
MLRRMVRPSLLIKANWPELPVILFSGSLYCPVASNTLSMRSVIRRDRAIHFGLQFNGFWSARIISLAYLRSFSGQQRIA